MSREEDNYKKVDNYSPDVYVAKAEWEYYVHITGCNCTSLPPYQCLEYVKNGDQSGFKEWMKIQGESVCEHLIPTEKTPALAESTCVVSTAKECLDLLEILLGAGFHVPYYVIEEIEKDIEKIEDKIPFVDYGLLKKIGIIVLILSFVFYSYFL
jgi:hypothetical protein